MANKPTIDFGINLSLNEGSLDLGALERAFAQVAGKGALSEKIFAPVVKGGENMVKSVQRQRKQVAEEFARLQKDLESSLAAGKADKDSEKVARITAQLKELKKLTESFKGLSELHVVSKEQANLLRQITSPDQYAKLNEAQRREHDFTLGALRQQLELVNQIKKSSMNLGMVNVAANVSAQGAKISQVIGTNAPKTDTERQAERNRKAARKQDEEDAAFREALNKRGAEIDLRTKLDHINKEAKEKERADREAAAKKAELDRKNQKEKENLYKVGKGSELVNLGALNNVPKLDKQDYGSVKAFLSSGESQARLAASRATSKKEHDEQIALAEDYYAKLKKLEADWAAAKKAASDKRTSDARKEADEEKRLAKEVADQRTLYGKQLFERGISSLGKQEIRPVKEYLSAEYNSSRASYGQSKALLDRAVATGNTADIAKHTADMNKHAQAVQHFSNATVELNKHAKELGGTMTMLNGLFQNFTRFAVGYGALYQLTGAFSALRKEVVQFDKQMRSLQAVSEATDAQLVRIASSIKEVAKGSSFSLTELAEGAKTLAQAGVAAEDLGSALSATEKFARATATSMATAADLITTYRDVYKELSDTTISDQLTKAVNISKLTGEDLKTILSLGASTAKGFGIASEQLLGQIATLRNAGIKASTVGTGLRQTMLELFNLDDKAVKALQERYKQIGEDLSQSAIKEMYFNFSKADNPMLSAITELKRIGFGGEGQQVLGRAFDIRAVNAISAMVANIDQLVENEKKLTFGGAAAQAADTQMRSLSNSVTKLQNQFMDLGVSMSSGLVANLKWAVDQASLLLTKVEEINEAAKRATGGNAGSASAGLGGATALASLAFTGKMGFAKRAMVAGGAFAAGTAAGEYGASQGISPETISNIMNIMFLVQVLSGIGKKLLAIRAERIAAAEFVGPVLTRVGKVGIFFAAIRTAFAATTAAEGLSLLMAGGPMGWIAAGLTAVAGAAFFLNKAAKEAPDALLKKDAAEATSKRQQAAEDAALASAKYAEVKDRKKNFDLGSPGNPAAEGTFAADVIKLGENMRDVDLMFNQYMGGYGNNVDELKVMLEALRDANTDDQKKAIFEKIKSLAANPSADLTEKDAESLAAEMANVKSTYKALVSSFTQRVSQLNDTIKANGPGAEEARKELEVLDSIKGLNEIISNPTAYSPEDMRRIATEYANRMAAIIENGGKALAENAAAEFELNVKTVIETLLTADSKSQITVALNSMLVNMQNLGLTAAEKVQEINRLISAAEKEISATAQKKEDLPFYKKLTDMTGMTNYGLQLSQEQFKQEQNTILLRRQADPVKKQLVEDENNKLIEDARKSYRGGETAFKGFSSDGAMDRALKVLARNGQPGEAEKLKAAFESFKNGTSSKEQNDLLSQQYQKLAGSIIKTPEVPSFAETPQEISRGGEIQRKIDELKTNQKYGPELDKLLEEKKNLDLQVAQKKVDEAEYELKQIQKGDKGYREAENKVARAKDEYENVRTRNNKEVLEVGKAAADLAEKNAKERLALEQRMAETSMKGDVRKAKYAARIGDTATIDALQPGFAEAQVKAKEAFIQKLKMDRATPEEIADQVAQRDDLTRSLASQKEVVDALAKSWALEDQAFKKREDRAATTGDLNKDAILASQGVGFSREEKVAAVKGNISAIDEHIAAEKQRQEWTTKSLQDQLKLLEGKKLTEVEIKTQQGLQDELLDSQTRSNERLYELEEKRAGKIGEIYQLTTNVDKEIKAGFSADKLRRDLTQSGNAIQNYGKSIRSQLVGAWESVGDAIGETLAEGQDFGDQMRQIVHDLSKDFLKLTLRTGMNQLGDKLLGKVDGSNSQPGLFNDFIEGAKRLFGFGKEAGPDQVGQKTEATSGGGFFSSLGNLFSPILDFLGLGGKKDTATTAAAPDIAGGVKEIANAATGTGTMNVTAAVVNVNGGSGSGSPVDQAIGAATGEQGAQKEGGLFGWAKSAWGSIFGTPEQQLPEGQAGPPAPGKSGFMESITSLFSGDGPISKGLTDLFGKDGSLGSMLGGLFTSLLGGGGAGGDGPSTGAVVANIAAKAAMSYFSGGAGAAATAATGGVIRGFSRGGWVEGPGRRGGIIRGPGTGTSDSIPAFAHGRNGSTPIAVSNGEAILTEKATNFLGKGFIDAVNSGAVVKHAAGRFAKESRGTEGSMNSGLSKLHVGGGTSAPPVVENNITNVMDPSVTRDYLESRAGSRVMVNTLKRKGVI